MCLRMVKNPRDPSRSLTARHPPGPCRVPGRGPEALTLAAQSQTQTPHSQGTPGAKLLFVEAEFGPQNVPPKAPWEGEPQGPPSCGRPPSPAPVHPPVQRSDTWATTWGSWSPSEHQENSPSFSKRPAAPHPVIQQHHLLGLLSVRGAVTPWPRSPVLSPSCSRLGLPPLGSPP